ncbi:unnamed protein product, partial [marine sediment metagenome]
MTFWSNHAGPGDIGGKLSRLTISLWHFWHLIEPFLVFVLYRLERIFETSRVVPLMPYAVKFLNPTFKHSGVGIG